MSDEQTAIVPKEQIYSAIQVLSEGLDFSLDTSVVKWTDVREVIAPQGEVIPAAELVGSTFALYRVKPFPSTQPGGRDVVYWCVGKTDDQTVFNTVLGGQAVCDILDRFVELNRLLKQAEFEKDVDTAEQLRAVGAGKAWAFTLQQKLSGNGRMYYVFE